MEQFSKKYTSWWESYKEHVQEIVLSSDYDNRGDVFYWRNAVFCNILTYLTPLSLIALIPSTYMAFMNNVPVVGFADLFSFLLVIIITILPGIKLEIRKSILFFILYCLSVTLLYYLPLPGPGLLFLLSITIFSSLIYSSSAAYYSAFINTFICICFALLIYFGIDVPISLSYNLGSWMAISSNLIFLSFACAKCLDLLFTGLTAALKDKEVFGRKFEKTNRLYKFISQINQGIVHTKDESTLFYKSCLIAYTIGKFKMAWIGKFDNDNKKILLVDQNGIPENSIHLFSASYEKNGPQDHVLRSGSYYVCNDIANDLEIDSWKPFAKLNGLNSCIILPIKKEKEIIGSFNIYSSEINFFDEAEIALLVEATGDISFALDVFEKDKRHKLAEEQIIKNENRFRALIEKSKDLKMLSNINGEFIYGSPSVTKLFGYSTEEFLHKSAFTFFHPDDLPDLMKERNKILEIPGGSFPFQYRILHKNGSWIWCEGTLTNMLHEPGIHAFVSNFNDISERKQAEVKAEKLTDRLDLATTSAALGIWDWDIANNILLWDKRMYKLYNISEKEFSSIYEGWTSRIHEDDRTRVVAEMQDAIEGIKDYNTEFRIVWKDSSLHHIKASGIIERNSKGEAVRIIGANWDITDIIERQEQIIKSELFNRGLINSITSLIAVLDKDGTITNVNSAWEQFGLNNGLTSLEGIGIGVNYFDVCEKAASTGDIISANILKGMKDVMSEKENVFYLEYPCHSPTDQRWFSIRVMKFEGKEGLIIALHTDITDKKNEEEEKEKISNDLVERNKNLEQFSHIVSHNLRAPVTNILGFAELLKYQGTNPSLILDSMKGMSNAAYKLDEVIKDLNDILQIRAVVSENKEEIHFQSLVNDISLSIDNIIKKENVIIRTDFTSIDKMHSVKTYLYSIFYNLIINSIKFHKPGISPFIEIKSIRTSNGVRIIFKDNGMGIDLEKYHENIFGLYKRFHLQVEGKGMGMFMTKTQVETLGGKISVISTVNIGTEFTLEFEKSEL